jgi:GAF domain-containing protein
VRATPSGDVLEVLHSQGWPDDLARELRVLQADAPLVVAEAYRIGTAVWLATPAALEQSYPNAVELARKVGDQAWAAAPLRVDGRVTGAVALGFPRPRDLDADERRFLLTIAQQIAQALERARLRDERG